jgi:YVTN family beta-propeller protein
MTLCLRILAIFLLALPLAAADKVRIIQTNSAGDNIHIIDPETNTVIGEIKGIDVNHGAAAAPDGSRLYVTNEAFHTLDVADLKTMKVTKKIPLSGRPNNVAIGKDGRRVYVAVAVAPGAVDVIDTATLEKAKSIPIRGAVHNTYVTPDGKYVIAGSIQGRTLTAIDAQTEKVAWVHEFDLGVRPMAFSQNPDGSTKWIFTQLSNLNGFAVLDFQTRKVLHRISHPEQAPGKTPVTFGGNASHGIAVTPDQRTLIVTSVGAVG